LQQVIESLFEPPSLTSPKKLTKVPPRKKYMKNYSNNLKKKTLILSLNHRHTALLGGCLWNFVNLN
jgi:hypothetical protein